MIEFPECRGDSCSELGFAIEVGFLAWKGVMSMEVNRKSVRIRLCFEERGMLSKAQVDQGLAKSWYLVNADVLDIGQLAAHINHDYRLRESCPKGLVLEVSQTLTFR